MEYINTKLNRITFFVLSLLVFLMPVFFLPVNMVGITQAKISLFSILTLVAFCFFVCDWIKAGKISLRFNWGYVLLLLITIASIVSTIYGVNSQKSFVGMLVETDTVHMIIVGSLFVFMLGHVVITKRRVKTLVMALLSSISFAILYQILRLALPSVIPSFGLFDVPIVTLSGNWSELTILSLVLLGVFVVTLETTRFRKWVYGVLVPLLLVPFFFVALSVVSIDFYFFSATLPLVVTILSVLFFAYIYSFNKLRVSKDGGETSTPSKSSTRFMLLPSFVVLAISIVLVVFGSPISNFLVSKTNVAYIEGRPNWQATNVIISKVIAQKPLFGSGPNSFAEEWNLNKPAEVNSYPFWSTDFQSGVGTIPSLLATQGIVGFALYILFYAFVLFGAFRILFKSKVLGVSVLESIVVPFGVIATTAFYFFYTPGVVICFVHLFFVGLLFAVIGRNATPKEIHIDRSQLGNFVSVLVAILVVISSLYWIYVVTLKGIANYEYRKALQAKDVSTAIVLLQNALALDYNNTIYHQTLTQLYVARIAQLASTKDQKQNGEEINALLNNAILSAVNAENLNKLDYNLRMSTGKTLEFFGSIGLKDAYKSALQKYEEAHSLSPSNPLPLLLLSNLSLTLNDRQSAKEYLIKSLSLKDSYADNKDLETEIAGLINRINVTTEVKTVSTTSSRTKDTKK